MKKRMSFLVFTCCAGILLGAGGQEEERSALLRHRDGKSDSDSDHRYSDFLDSGVTLADIGEPDATGVSADTSSCEVEARDKTIKVQLSQLAKQKRDALISILEKGEKDAGRAFANACAVLSAGSLDLEAEVNTIWYTATSIRLVSFDSRSAHSAAVKDAAWIMYLFCAESRLDTNIIKARGYLHRVMQDAHNNKKSHVWKSEDWEQLQIMLRTLRTTDHTA